MKYRIDWGFIPETENIYSGEYTESKYKNSKGDVVRAHKVTIVHVPEANITRPVVCKGTNPAGEVGYFYRDFVQLKED